MAIDISQMKAADFTKELPDMVQNLEAVRSGNTQHSPMDISFEETLQNKWGLSLNAFEEKIGLNTKVATMQNVFSMLDQNIRWIVPEIIRSAITVGMRTAPFYSNIITTDQPISGLTAIQPHINMSDAVPAKVNEAETIPLGNISFGQKSVRLFKIGKGFKLTDEVKNYVSLDILGIYLRDFGVQLGYAMDTLAMNTLMNGNMIDGSESAPVIGVKDPTKGLVYKDLLRIWVRAARLGRNFTTIIGGEDQAVEMLDLPEFKTRQQGTTEATLNLHSPVPNKADMYIHSSTPANQLVLVDTSAALVKLTAKQLSLESERIVSNQTEAIYASLTTGFSKMYNDSVILLDSKTDFSKAGFPSFMNVDQYISGINLE